MARETMDLIRQAEQQAEQIVRDAKQEAERILKEAQEAANAGRKQAQKSAAEKLDAVQKESKAQGETESGDAARAVIEEIDRLKEAAAAKKDEAVQMIIHEIL